MERLTVMSAKRFLFDIRAVLADPYWHAEGDAGDPANDVPDTPQERADLANFFAALAGKPAPDAILPALVLPDIVRLRWQRDGAAGEMAISNPIYSLGRRLDDSLLAEKIDGIPLGELRILDAVTDLAGPFYVVFQAGPDRVDPQLLLFDLREILPLQIDFTCYIETAAAARGILFWQHLFTHRKLTQDRARHLRSGLELLHRSGVEGVDALDRLLKQRTL